MSDDIRDLVHALRLKLAVDIYLSGPRCEFGCGNPATIQSEDSNMYPICEACRDACPNLASLRDWAPTCSEAQGRLHRWSKEMIDSALKEWGGK